MLEILLIISLVSWLFKKPSNVLYCGIFAWTGDSNKKFSWDKFNILGILNNERGGDSCGRVSGDISQYGIGKTSDYYDFLDANEPFPVKEKMIIGHDRKASFGYAITEQNAQPVVLEEDGEIVYVLAHNGTIYNIEDIAKKYEINRFGKTDSWVLAKILYTYGYDVLKEYEGAAALVIYDRRKFLETGDTFINIFKGKSRPTEYVNYSNEERPLYLMDKGNNSVYISSVSSALRSIGAKKENLYDIECNRVFTFKNGIAVPTYIEIDRSDMTQTKTYPKTTTYYPAKKSYKGNYNSRYSEYDGYSERDDWWKNDKGTQIKIDEEAMPYGNGKIDFKRGLFCTETHFLNGIIHLNKDGHIVTPKDKDGAAFYFINGVMVSDHEDYHKASRAIKTENATAPEDVYPILLKYSVYPVYFDTGSPKGKCFYNMDKIGSRHVYNGELQPVFSSFKYTIKNGLATASEYVTVAERLYPSKVFNKKDEPENYPALNYNEDFEGDKYKNMEDQITEQEVSHIMAEVLEVIGKARTNLEAIGNEGMVKILSDNLNTIEDTLFIQEDGNLYKKSLKLTAIWEKIPF